ncbi:MAG: sugar O-acetyltransferase [Candidatus Thermoplasmatota archaeon]|nr:sugar O-acetyltransferase [Candidatus Thermoplasmatota archaeon]
MSWYYAFNDELQQKLDRAYALCQKLLALKRGSEEYKEALKQLFGGIGNKTVVRVPFFCDYGKNIFIGSDCFINYDCVFLDEGRIDIGDRVWIGPGVHIYGVEHKLEVDKRSNIRDVPVVIENDVWIGGHATILPGITLGRGCAVGAGSVVTKSVDSKAVVAGNPAKEIRKTV